MPDDQQPEPFQVPLVWVGVDEAPIHFTNQMLGQFVGREELVLTFGQAAPPALLGSYEERLEQMRQISYVPVRVIARLSLTRSRLAEFHRVIGETLDNYDKMDMEESA
jgi:hypothetical protein